MRPAEWFTGKDNNQNGLKDITWYRDDGQEADAGYLDAADRHFLAYRIDGTEAHVTVGLQPNPGQMTTAAVIHEARFGAGADAPWEVIGTDDTNFSITQPAYGSTLRVTLGRMRSPSSFQPSAYSRSAI